MQKMYRISYKSYGMHVFMYELSPWVGAEILTEYALPHTIFSFQNVFNISLVILQEKRQFSSDLPWKKIGSRDLEKIRKIWGWISHIFEITKTTDYGHPMKA